MQTKSYEGRCHCGAIGFGYRSAIPVERWSVRACQCSFCRAHDAMTSSDPLGELEFSEHQTGDLKRYRFGGKTADFLICGRCGVYLGAQMRTAERALGIINVRALRDVPENLPAATPMSYQGEDLETRRERRLARWTPMASLT